MTTKPSGLMSGVTCRLDAHELQLVLRTGRAIDAAKVSARDHRNRSPTWMLAVTPWDVWMRGRESTLMRLSFGDGGQRGLEIIAKIGPITESGRDRRQIGSDRLAKLPLFRKVPLLSPPMP